MISGNVFKLFLFLVTGSVTLVASLLKLIHSMTMTSWARDNIGDCVMLFETFVIYFVHYFISFIGICWFIAGSVFVFRFSNLLPGFQWTIILTFLSSETSSRYTMIPVPRFTAITRCTCSPSCSWSCPTSRP